MIFYVGITDLEWFRLLSKQSPEDINFWQPGAQGFKAISQGAPFLFKLKYPINKIAGLGFFSTYSKLPVEFAWEVFRERNGVNSLASLKHKINSLRKPTNTIDINPVIGCKILSQPVFFRDQDWIPVPTNWSPSIQVGKTYSTESEDGKSLWARIEGLLTKYKLPGLVNEQSDLVTIFDEHQQRYGPEQIIRPRHGQGAFRVIITDIYNRRCAISGEKTLPVLEAAHIKPYEELGPHMESNGLLLRADLHLLFDKGYLTVTNQYKVEVSKRIKEEFENGRDYYKYHGNSLVALPSNQLYQPSREFLEWHQNKFKG